VRRLHQSWNWVTRSSILAGSVVSVSNTWKHDPVVQLWQQGRVTTFQTTTNSLTFPTVSYMTRKTTTCASIGYSSLPDCLQRKTKLKLHFTILCFCAHRPAKTDYGFPPTFPWPNWICNSLTFPGEWSRWTMKWICYISLVWQCIDRLLTTEHKLGIRTEWRLQRNSLLIHMTLKRPHIDSYRYPLYCIAQILQTDTNTDLPTSISNRCLPGKPGLASAPLVFLSCSEREHLEISGTGCVYRPRVLPVTKTTSVKALKETKHWPKPVHSSLYIGSILYDDSTKYCSLVQSTETLYVSVACRD